MTQLEFDRMCMQIVDIVRRNAPYRTGNLRYDAIKFRWINDKTFKIWVDCKENGVAPYMPYTNEPWISDRWNGKQNPNEGWWQRTAEEIADHIASVLGVSYEESGEQQ